MLDPDFYSAAEVALLVQEEVPGDARAQLAQALRDESIRSQLAPRTITEGFMFLPRVEGGRYVDIRLQGDAYLLEMGQIREGAVEEASTAAPPRELRFDFALALPDGDFDYERLDTARIYPGDSLPDLDVDQLRSTLEQLPCCATDADGEGEGDPLNFVIVGEVADVLNSLSRSGWSFTHRIDFRTVRREIGAAVAGSAYPVAPVSSLYVFGRKQEVALQRARRSIAQRNHMRLWLAPYRFEGRPVWIGQISRDIGVKVTPKSPTLTTHIIDPEVDTTREYLLHSLITEGFVDRFGFVKGSAAGTPSQPRVNLTGDPYHSDGLRLVVILSVEPVPPDQIRSLLWEQSAAPFAEGQSEAASRNVRPIK
jgi:LssY C-terminus